MENYKQSVAHSSSVNADVTTWALPDFAIARLGRGIATEPSFSPNRQTLAVGSWVGLWLYDISTMAPIALLDTERGVVFATVFSYKGDLIATGNWDGDVKVWDVQNQHCISKMRRGRFDRVSKLVFSRDGQRLASSGGHYGTVYVWHPETGNQIMKSTVEKALKPRHRSTRIPLAFSPDGNLLAGAISENTLSIWDIEAAKQITCLTGHSSLVNDLIFSPCGQFLVSSNMDGTLQKWEVNRLSDAEPDSLVFTLQEEKQFVNLAYLSNGTLLAVAVSDCQNHIAVWDVEHNKKLWINANPLGYTSRTWTPYFSARYAFPNLEKQHSSTKIIGLGLAVRGTHTIHVFDLDKPTTEGAVIDEHTPTAYSLHSLKFSQDGQTLVGAGDVTTLWDVNSKHSKRILTKTEYFGGVYFTDYGTLKVVGSDSENSPQVWEICKQDALNTEWKNSKILFWLARDCSIYLGTRKLFMIDTHETRILTHAFSPDNSLLVVALENRNEAYYTVELWDVERGVSLASLPLTILLHRDMYKGNAESIKHCLVKEPHNRELMGLTFSPFGNLIAGGLYGEIRLWDTMTYETRMVICPPKGCRRSYTLTFSPCGKYLASGAWWNNTDKVSIRIWEIESGKNIVTFWGHSSDVQCLTFSPDGQLLASSGLDGTILLWDVKFYIGT